MFDMEDNIKRTKFDQRLDEGEFRSPGKELKVNVY